MDQTLALLSIGNFVACTALLALASELVLAAPAGPAPLRAALMVVAAVSASSGLWWPSHALRAQDAAGALRGAAALLPLLPALALVGLAGLIGALWRRGRKPWVWPVGLVMPVAAYVFAMFGAPGVFRLAQTPGWLGAGGLTLGLSAALVATQLPLGPRPRARTLRLASAMAAAMLACLGAAISVPPYGVPGGFFVPEWWVLAGFIGLGSVLLAVLGAPGGLAQDRPAARSRRMTLDPLTGLPTRLHFEAQLIRAAKRCDERPARLAVWFIDLDGFKPVNDTLGHSVGDRVLEQVGQRLAAFAKGSGVAARVGGDEFLMLLPGVESKEKVAELAGRFIAMLSQPYRVDGRQISISCSVGMAMYPDKCLPNKLIARADAAMYAAKRAGGSRHGFYSPEMEVDVNQNFDLLRELRQALAKDEFELFYQPKIDARSGKVTAAEALLRWNHPTRGMIMPGLFLPVAERSGLMGPIGNWVIEAACKQSRAWRDKGLRMRVAINLSAHQMRQDDIVDRIAEALTRHRIHPSLLTCEITESAAMEDTAATQETFRRLGELGAHLSIDDFGTGFSSLSYLRQLPAEELKIDASFVKDVDHSADARVIVDAVVKLAHALGLKVVAEGVESPRQQAVLVELGCDELQGYLFAKPMSARALLMWALDDRSSTGAFRDSLFGETREASRLEAGRVTRRAV